MYSFYMAVMFELIEQKRNHHLHNIISSSIREFAFCRGNDEADEIQEALAMTELVRAALDLSLQPSFLTTTNISFVSSSGFTAEAGPLCLILHPG